MEIERRLMKIEFDVEAVIAEMAAKVRAEAATAEAKLKEKAENVAKMATEVKAKKEEKRKDRAKERLEDALKRTEIAKKPVEEFLGEVAHLIPQYVTDETEKVTQNLPSMKLVISFYKGDGGPYSAQIIGGKSGDKPRAFPAATIQQLGKTKDWRMEKLQRELDIPELTPLGMMREIKRLRDIIEAKETLDGLRGE